MSSLGSSSDRDGIRTPASPASGGVRSTRALRTSTLGNTGWPKTGPRWVLKRMDSLPLETANPTDFLLLLLYHEILTVMLKDGSHITMCFFWACLQEDV